MDGSENSSTTVAIIGRPNVGKSSLFNAILKKRLAIVHHESGVTRDRIIAPVHWYGRNVQLIDTGGLGTFSAQKKNLSIWDHGIREQVDAAIEGADILLFVTDVQDGIAPLDHEIAGELRNSGKHALLVINKVDNAKLENEAMEFSCLGFPEMYPVSSLHRKGIEELLETALKDVPDCSPEKECEQPFRIAVIGRPNVGKSSFINKMLGEKRVLVSDVAGTTRDSIDIEFELDLGDEKLPAVLIDTAGLRKKSKVRNAIEKFSIIRAREAVKRAQLVIFIIEASPQGATAQDRKIAQMIHDEGKASIIAANKWDLCEGQKKKKIEEELRYSLPFLSYVPIIFTCALSGYNFERVLQGITDVRDQLSLKLTTSMVNQIFVDAVNRNSPPVVGRKPLKIYYATMKRNDPPTFILFVNDPEFCSRSYLNYLSNYIRKVFSFSGLPIRIQLRKRPRRQ